MRRTRPRLWTNTLIRAFLLEQLFFAAGMMRFEQLRKTLFPCAPHFSARGAEARASIWRPIGTQRSRPSRKRRRAFVRTSASRARAARFGPERDERGRGGCCTREVADRERGVGLGGLLGLGGGTRGPQGVAAMARVRAPCLCRRDNPSRALPAVLRRHETASRGAHRPRKTRDPRSRASRVPTRNLRSRPLPKLHSTKRRLVALASGRRPVSDGGFTGVRASSARRARPPAPRPSSDF